MTLGAALSLGAFLLFGPAALVLFPLGLLLLWSGGMRLTPVLAATCCAFISALWFTAPGGLADQTLKGWTAAATGAFLLYTLGLGRRSIDAALLATLTGAAAVALWLAAYHVPLQLIIDDAVRTILASYRLLGDLAPVYRPQIAEMGETIRTVAIVFPSVMLLSGLAGLAFAWRWMHLLVPDAPGTPPAPFAEFRFSDHVVWLVVIGMAGTVAQVADLLPTETIWPANLLVLAGALYMARGSAVVTTLAPIPARLRIPLLLLLLVTARYIQFLIPFAVTGLLGIGLADTWLDFRRRAAAASGDPA